MSSPEVIASFSEDDSDTFSVDSLEVNTSNETRNIIKATSQKSPTQGIESTNSRSVGLQDRSISSYLGLPNRIGGDGFCLNTEDVLAWSPRKFPIEGYKQTEKRSFPLQNTVKRGELPNKTQKETCVDTVSIQETSNTLVNQSKSYPFNGVEYMEENQPNTVDVSCPTTKMSEGTCVGLDGCYIEVTEEIQEQHPQKVLVTVPDCTSKLVCTSLRENVEKNYTNKNLEEKAVIPHKRFRKKIDQIKVPFYRGEVDLGEIRKLQELNKSVSKDRSIHVLMGEGEYSHTNRSQSKCQGVIERWRHKVKPIYEHSVQEKSRASAMTTISDDISKMKIGESNSGPKRVTKSVCGVTRSRSPRTCCLQVEKPAQPYRYLRRKAPSYLEQYRVAKYGPIYVKKKPPSDGTECSECDSSTVVSLTSELKEVPEIFSSPESSGDEMSFYRRVINGELTPGERLSDEYDNLRSVSQVNNMDTDRPNRPCKRPNYVPYSLEDYRTMLQPTRLGRLGPDLEANREKFERLRRQREYGDLASLKNIQKIQLKKKICYTEFQPRLKSQPPFNTGSLRLPTTRVSEDDCLYSKTRYHEPYSSVYEAPLKSASSTTASETPSSNRRTPKKPKRKEQPTFKSNKPLLKMMQERHKRELEMTEKLKRENLV